MPIIIRRPAVPGLLEQLALLEKVQTMAKGKLPREPWDMEPHELLAKVIAAAGTVSYDSANLLAEHLEAIRNSLESLEGAIREVASKRP